MANDYFPKIQGYLLELGFEIHHVDEDSNLLVVSRPELGIDHMVLGCGEPLLIMEQYLLDLPAPSCEIYQRLQKAGIVVDRAVYDAGVGEVDRLLEQRIAQVSFGEAAARQRSLRDDPQLRRALELLQRGTTQKELFALASARTGTR